MSLAAQLQAIRAAIDARVPAPALALMHHATDA